MSDLKVELCFFPPCISTIMPYIFRKFHDEILNGFNVTERTQITAGNKQRGIMTSELKVGLWLFVCTSSDHALYL